MEHPHANRHSERVVDVRAASLGDATLARWLLDAGAKAVLLRPDRVVPAAVPFSKGGATIARDAGAWLPLLPPSRTAPHASGRNAP
ncbi:hypothetical protein GCM10010404_78790 [Nonomuraea africana]